LRIWLCRLQLARAQGQLLLARRLAAIDADDIEKQAAGHRDEQHGNEQIGIERPQIDTLIRPPGMPTGLEAPRQQPDRRREPLAG
jgi:hypothetical protein